MSATTLPTESTLVDEQPAEENPAPIINSTIKRVFITNIPGDVSETILQDFLKDYEPTAVLIPYHYITRYSGRKAVVPLGVGYADFPTPQLANKVVLEINETSISESSKKLKVKLFEAYDPQRAKNVQHRIFKHLNRQSPITNEAVESPAEETSHQNNEVEQVVPESPEAQPETSSIAYSKTWIYVSNLTGGILDTDLAEHFKEYLPNDIYLFQFKSKKPRGKFFHKIRLSAIINLPAVEGIENIALEVSNKTHLSKLRNAKISVQPCIEKKVLEVIEAAKIKEQEPIVECVVQPEEIAVQE